MFSVKLASSSGRLFGIGFRHLPGPSSLQSVAACWRRAAVSRVPGIRLQPRQLGEEDSAGSGYKAFPGEVGVGKAESSLLFPATLGNSRE